MNTETNFKIEYLTRQMDLIPIKKLDKEITVIGAGAIGSHTVMALARMGFANITVWDYDNVSDENMNNQGYSIPDIGRPKVEVLREKVQLAMGLSIKVERQRFIKEPLRGIVIMAVDSMDARKTIWNSCSNAEYIIDARMGAEFAKLYIMEVEDAKDRLAYVKTLYSDEDARRENCTAKSTIYTAYLISGLVAKGVKDIVLQANYTRVLDYNIRDNAMLCYKKEK